MKDQARRYRTPTERADALGNLLAFAIVNVAAIFFLAHLLATNSICPPRADAAEPHPVTVATPGPEATPRPTPIVVGFPPARTPAPVPSAAPELPATDTE
jgi:hypothetical protein